MTHLRQPTKRSCGPTCIAMILDLAVEDVRKVQSGATNVAEMVRLLAPRYRLGRELLGIPGADVPLALLKLRRPRHCNWHWAIWRDGLVYDPLADAPRPITAYLSRKISYYEVEQQ